MVGEAITSENKEEIINQTKEKGGYIILQCVDGGVAEIDLYGNSIPRPSRGERLFIEGTNHPHDRKYILRKRRHYSDVTDFTIDIMFARLELGDYEFMIDCPSSMQFTIDEKTDLYLGPVGLNILIEVLREKFIWAVQKVGAVNIGENGIDQMVAYAFKDLSTGEALAQNISANNRTDSIAYPAILYNPGSSS